MPHSPRSPRSSAGSRGGGSRWLSLNAFWIYLMGLTVCVGINMLWVHQHQQLEHSLSVLDPSSFAAFSSSWKSISGPQRQSDLETIQDSKKEAVTAKAIVVDGGSLPPLPGEYTKLLKRLEEKTGKKSCRRDASGTFTWFDHCATSTNVVLGNTLNLPRYFCGNQLVKEEGFLSSKDCTKDSTARLFPVVPDLNGTGMLPVNLRFGGTHGSKGDPFACDVPCQSYRRPAIVTYRYVDSIDGKKDLTLSFSMEGPQYYKQLRINPDAYKSRKFYSTTSYNSEVPLPYYSWAEWDIRNKAPVDFDKAIKGASFMARNCDSRNKREKVVKALEASIFRVDSLSSCLHNAEPPPGVNLAHKDQVMKKYLFYLAFENQNEDDYITEKLWGPLGAGTVPVYFGAGNVKEHVPDHSIVVVSDFPDYTALAQHLQKVADSKELYEEYHAWRKKPLSPHFHAKYDFTHIHSTCRTCRWAYAKFYGLGWDHENQSLRPVKVPREPCVGKAGTLLRPVVESWGTDRVINDADNVQPEASPTCPLKIPQTWVSGGIRRTVYSQDGVTDLWVQNEGHDGSPSVSSNLRLEPVFSSTDPANKAHLTKEGRARIQSKFTRYSVLTWPPVPLHFSDASPYSIDIPVTHSQLRIRVIAEDVDLFHKGAHIEESYFGELMTRDFLHPAERFV